MKNKAEEEKQLRKSLRDDKRKYVLNDSVNESIVDRGLFVSHKATNAPVDRFHFNEEFRCEELCVSLTKTNRLSE